MMNSATCRGLDR